jgi:hypothetical protein
MRWIVLRVVLGLAVSVFHFLVWAVYYYEQMDAPFKIRIFDRGSRFFFETKGIYLY